MRAVLRVFIFSILLSLSFSSLVYSLTDDQEILKYQISETEVLSITIKILENTNLADELDQIDIPEPPFRESSDPRRIIRYFCNAWKDEKFNIMYGAMDQSYKERVSFEDFSRVFAKDKEFNGGLLDENINQEEGSIGSMSRYKMQLFFNNERFPPKTIFADVVKTINGYRIADSGILPVDFENL